MKQLIRSIFIGLTIFIFIFPLPGNGTEKKTPVVDLKELLRIEDNGIDFYFKYPKAPVIDPKGFFYVLDHKQLMKFDKTGKFLGNYYKEGLGPGEINDANKVFIQADHVVVYNRLPSKLLWLSQTDGTLKQEARLSDELGYSDFLTYYNNKYFFFRESFPNTKGKAVIIDLKVKLLSYNIESETFTDENLFYLKKYFVSRFENSSGIKNVNFVQVCNVNDHTFLIANNGNYEVQRFDLKEKKITPFINREYKKILVKEAWKEHFYTFRFLNVGLDGKERKTWSKKSLDDIQKMYRFGSKIWIVTSTFDEKSRLVNTDVFDLNGKYINTFLFKLPEKMLIYRINLAQITLHNDHLFIFERNEDGDYELVEYKLINVPAWAK